MSRSVSVNLNDKASDELRTVAYDLQVSESEVLRKGLAVMKVYSEAKKDDEKASLMLKVGDTVHVFILL